MPLMSRQGIGSGKIRRPARKAIAGGFPRHAASRKLPPVRRSAAWRFGPGAPPGDVLRRDQGINAVVECRTGNLQPHVHVMDCGGREARRSHEAL